MPEITLLESSEDEDEEIELFGSLAIDTDDSRRFNPASFGSLIQERFIEPFLNHPAAVRVPVRNAKAATRLKEKGNELYKKKDYFEAYDIYTEALDYAPLTTGFGNSRAIFFNNRAACSMMMSKYELAVEDCTASVELDPRYVKAYMRRAQAYENLEDLDAALADIKKALEVDSTYPAAKKEYARLEPIVKEKNEKLKDEMMGKLKDLGNTVLGKFGMSLNNFQAVQDPASGSYSISYNPGGS